MVDNKYFVDINNLNRFWSNAKEYADNNNNSSSLEYVYIPSIFDETYTLESSKYYDFGLSSELNIVLEEKLNNEAIEYNFQFRSGNIATKLNINGRIISDTERYCIHRVKVVGGMVDIAKSEIPQYFCIEQIGEEACNINFNLNNPFELSVNGEDWMSIPANSSDINIPLNVGRYIYIRSNATITSTVGTISSTGLHKLSGNIMSLIYGDDFKGKIDMEALGLPTLAFKNSFKSSTGLIDSSCLELSPKILNRGCYQYMFDGCSSMINSPELNIDYTDLYCYMYMFRGCSNLRKIVMSSNTPLNILHCQSFLQNVPDDNTRTIYINSTYFVPISSMPKYWKYKFIGEPNYHIQPLTFNVLSEGSFSFSKNDIQYCIFSSDGANANNGWTTLTAGSSTPTIAAGSKIVWRGNIQPASDNSGIGIFSSTGNYSIEGNIMSLLYGSGWDYTERFDLTGFNYVFYRLFYNSEKLIDASNLILPATTLTDYCYDSMFYGCTKLTTAPELPATTLTPYCYQYMFYNCYSLTSAPELPAATLTPYCYNYMFYRCGSLKSITMLATDINADYCLYNWVSNVSSTGTFVKHFSMTNLPTGSSGIPSGWTVKDNVTITKCNNLEITADDVDGRATNTTIYYRATCDAVINAGQNIGKNTTAQIEGSVISAEFPQNTSTTNTVTRTITFEYMGVTATTTITQSVWEDKKYIVDLNNQWLVSSKPNPDSNTYEGVYESFSNYNVNDSAAAMYIDISGYNTFKLYIRSYAESNYDYVMVSQLDTTINNNTSYSDTTLVKAHTRGSQNSGTTIGSYKLVEFTNIDGGNHRITIVYRKDGSGHNNDDRGYVLIPKNQQ